MDLSVTNRRATALYYASGAVALWHLPTITWQWALAAVAVHILVISIFSAVTHRYFCHKAYEADRRLAWALSLAPIAYGYASPVSWAYMHTAHHAFADTEDDPHIGGWRGLFTASYKKPKASFKRAVGWFLDGKHSFVHHNALLIILAWGLLLWAISPQAFVWLLAAPMFTLKLGDGVHRAISHANGKALNRWYLEYVLPMGGEWIHDGHHDNAAKPIYRNRWFEPDWGGLIVKAISR